MRLLYVEDEKSLAGAVSTILVKNNYSVDVVHDGESPLDHLLTENYDGAIQDVMIPNLYVNGDEKALVKLISILLDNAMKYAAENGTVELRLVQSGKYAESLLETSLHGDADEAMIRRVQIEAQ